MSCEKKSTFGAFGQLQVKGSTTFRWLHETDSLTVECPTDVGKAPCSGALAFDAAFTLDPYSHARLDLVCLTPPEAKDEELLKTAEEAATRLTFDVRFVYPGADKSDMEGYMTALHRKTLVQNADYFWLQGPDGEGCDLMIEKRQHIMFCDWGRVFHTDDGVHGWKGLFPLEPWADPFVSPFGNVRVGEIKTDEQSDVLFSRAIHPALHDTTKPSVVYPTVLSLSVFRPFKDCKSAVKTAIDKLRDKKWGVEPTDVEKAAIEGFVAKPPVPLVFLTGDLLFVKDLYKKRGARFWLAGQFDPSQEKRTRNPAIWVDKPDGAADYRNAELRIGWVGKRKPIPLDMGDENAQYVEAPMGFSEVELESTKAEILKCAFAEGIAPEVELDRPLVLKGSRKTVSDPALPFNVTGTTFKTFFKRLYLKVENKGFTDNSGADMAEGETGLIRLVTKTVQGEVKCYLEAHFGDKNSQSQEVPRSVELTSV